MIRSSRSTGRRRRASTSPATTLAAGVAGAMMFLAKASAAGNRFRPDFADGLSLHRLLNAIVESSVARRWVDVERG